jgi:hypothetical protein
MPLIASEGIQLIDVTADAIRTVSLPSATEAGPAQTLVSTCTDRSFGHSQPDGSLVWPFRRQV